LYFSKHLQRIISTKSVFGDTLIKLIQFDMKKSILVDEKVKKS